MHLQSPNRVKKKEKYVNSQRGHQEQQQGQIAMVADIRKCIAYPLKIKVSVPFVVDGPFENPADSLERDLLQCAELILVQLKLNIDVYNRAAQVLDPNGKTKTGKAAGIQREAEVDLFASLEKRDFVAAVDGRILYLFLSDDYYLELALRIRIACEAVDSNFRLKRFADLVVLIPSLALAARQAGHVLKLRVVFDRTISYTLSVVIQVVRKTVDTEILSFA